jgi:anaerobic magnesium-protoporphyrin IX monomethyl ester cyclase
LSRFKKVLLIAPPFYRLLGSRNNWLSLGLHYIAAVLNAHGHYVRVYNADAAGKIDEANLATLFQENVSLQNAINVDDHPIWREVLSVVRNYDPDLVGITVTFSLAWKIVSKIANMIKNWNPEVMIAVGGAHATLAPDDIIKTGNIDFLVRGEGEYTMLELVEGGPIPEIEGLSWKTVNGGIVHNPPRKMIENLDELPFPDYELDLVQIDPKADYITIASSRGCSHHCVYCSSPKIWGRTVRFRSVENVIEEIKYRYYKYGVRRLHFVDDTFNFSRRYVKDLCSKIVSNNLNVSWSCDSRINLLDEDTLKMMKSAGCRRLKLGVESGSDRVLKMITKGTTVNQIKEKIKIVKKVGIRFTAYIMLGFPTETREEMMASYNLCKELNPDWVSLSIATPWIGTELYDMVQRQGITIPADELLFHQSSQSFINKNVTEDIVQKFLELNKGKKRYDY